MTVGHRYLKKGWGVDQCDTSPLHRVDQAVDCGLWNVVQFFFNGCAKLLDIVVHVDLEHPNMLNG